MRIKCAFWLLGFVTINTAIPCQLELGLLGKLVPGVKLYFKVSILFRFYSKLRLTYIPPV